VGIGTIVRVDGSTPVNGQIPKVYGIVIEGFSYTDLQSPMHDVMSHDGSPASAGFAVTERSEIRLYSAAVLRQIPDEPLQPVPMGEVYLAEEEDVAIALRMDGYLKEGASTGIPIGVYRAGATDSTIYLDAEFLLGPEAAHLNISGMSGLATKTSAVEWLLSSVFTHFPESKGSIAAVCFNVKGPDLCFIDQPGRLDERDLALYDKMGVAPKPFERVRYFAPYTAKGFSLNTLRSNEALLHNVTAAHVGSSRGSQIRRGSSQPRRHRRKADALIDFINERVLDRVFEKDNHLSRDHRVQSFADLEDWFKDLLRGLEKSNSDSWRTHHIATDKKGAQSPLEHLDAVRRSRHRHGHGERPSIRELRGPDGVCRRCSDARGGRAGPDLRAHCLQASRASRAPRSRCQTSHCIRRRAQQIRARGRAGHLRPQDAARHRRARTLPRPRALQRAAVQVTGPSARCR
jgi:hypothetical protein